MSDSNIPCLRFLFVVVVFHLYLIPHKFRYFQLQKNLTNPFIFLHHHHISNQSKLPSSHLGFCPNFLLHIPTSHLYSTLQPEFSQNAKQSSFSLAQMLHDFPLLLRQIELPNRNCKACLVWTLPFSNLILQQAHFVPSAPVTIVFFQCPVFSRLPFATGCLYTLFPLLDLPLPLHLSNCYAQYRTQLKSFPHFPGQVKPHSHSNMDHPSEYLLQFSFYSYHCVGLIITCFCN